MLRLLWLALLPAVLSADPRCAPCHAKQVSGYAETGMARSLFRMQGQPSGRFAHRFSGTSFFIESSGENMRQAIERRGIRAEYTVPYVIGSGNHGFAYMIQISDYLFQSPVAYYTRRKLWDMAPGYERDPAPDFTRPITAECLWCHSGKPRPVAGTLNRYESPPFAVQSISCDRCHGNAQEHLTAPSRSNIVNPAKLPAPARDSVCEQCHLGGEARIPNPGRKIADFQPGMQLEEVFSVFVFDREASGLKVVSHVEQLALSACARASGGRLWCGTCHDPHERPREPAGYYGRRCRACHAAELSPSHVNLGEDCVSCHMPRRPASDGGHTAFTDHRIQRPAAPTPASDSEGPRKLVPWRAAKGMVATRNLGLANVTVGERDQSAFHLDAGFRLLAEIYKESLDDPAVLTSLGLLLMRKSRPKEALALHERALALEPQYAPYYVNAGVAAVEAGDAARSIQHLERAIALDPSLEQAYRQLSQVYHKQGQPVKARAVLERYLRFMPGNLAVRMQLGGGSR